MAEDTRFVYGATCSWFGPIQAIGNTATHPKHQELMKRVNAPGRLMTAELPCCPHCGGMLLELRNRAEFMAGVPMFDKDHPGYAKFIEWAEEKYKTICYPDISKAIEVYNKETGSNFRL